MRMRKSWSRLTAAELAGRIADNSAMLEETTSERTLPQNLEAERSVLGAILLDSGGAAFGRAHPLRRTTSSRTRTGASTASMLELFAALDRDRRAHAARRSSTAAGAIEKVGGAAYLTSLLDGVPDVGNVEQYARIVKEKSTLRRLIRAGQRIVRDGLTGERDAEALLSEATGEIFDIAEGVRPGRVRADRPDRQAQPRDHRGRPRPAGHAVGPGDRVPRSSTG